jgi:hypothetical protein
VETSTATAAAASPATARKDRRVVTARVPMGAALGTRPTGR